MEISSLSATLPARPVTRQGDGQSPEQATQIQRQAMIQQANAALNMKRERQDSQQQVASAAGSTSAGSASPGRTSTFSIYA